MSRRRILIVDDEPVIAESLSELLEGWGYETAVASDGLLGLKHQTLISMIDTRHKQLRPKRTPPERRLRSIIKKGR